MAVVSLTLDCDDSKVPRIVAAFELRYGEKQPTETTKEFIERHIKEQLKMFIRKAENQIAFDIADDSFEDPFELPE